MSTVRLLEVDLMVLQVYMNGQMLQSLHFFMPGCVLTGLLGAMGGTLALITLSFMLGGRLYATKGGRGYTSLRWGSVLVIVLQCFFTMLVIDGNLGS